jgi:hypothetical protein
MAYRTLARLWFRQNTSALKLLSIPEPETKAAGPENEMPSSIAS